MVANEDSATLIPKLLTPEIELDVISKFLLPGNDLLKIEIDEAVYDIPEDGEMSSLKIKRLSVDFLMKGEILALPQYQKDLYTDEEVFWKTFPDTVKVLSSADEDYLKTYDNGIGSGIVFKHPCFHYDNEIFKEWDCGYILGTILIMQDM